MSMVSVIKYEGGNNILVWKHPCEDFASTTQLIVHESQEAIFFLNGQALDLFGAGRYTLETENIPLVSSIVKRATGDTSPFHAEVYFVNKTEKMALKWGTDSQVQYIEPTYNFPLAIGASGELSLSVADSRKLLVKLIGTENSITHESLLAYFKSFLMVRVKSYIAQTIKKNKLNIFELDENLVMFSDAIKGLLLADFADYGINLEKFLVTNIAKPDGDKQYEAFKALHFRQYQEVAEAQLEKKVDIIHAEADAQKTIITSQAMATKRAQEGYTYQQERGFDVAQDIARNEAKGQFTNMGVGLGTMVGVGGTVAGLVGGMMQGAVGEVSTQSTQGTQSNMSTCSKCGATLPKDAKFCANCGAKQESNTGTVVCPKCGKETPKGKFCVECGSPLIAKCPNCGGTLQQGAKFCQECGTKIEEA